MNDKMKALVEAAWAVAAHGAPSHADLCAVIDGLDCDCVYRDYRRLRDALDALDTEPEVVWHSAFDRRGAAANVEKGGLWTLSIRNPEGSRFFIWLAQHADKATTHGYADSEEQAKAAALRAARGEP